MARWLGALAAAVAGCGLATTGIGPALDGEGDASVDATAVESGGADVSSSEDAPAEATADAQVDATVLDGGDAAPDVKADVAPEVGPDVGPDVVDAGVPGTIGLPVAGGVVVDRVSPTDQGLATDGQNDGTVTVSIVGPIDGLIMVTSNAGGNTTGNTQWDTLVSTDAIPASISNAFNVGSSTWILGVYEGAVRRNDANGPISLGAGPHVLTLHMSNNGSLTNGTTFRIHARVTGGGWVGGPVFAW